MPTTDWSRVEHLIPRAFDPRTQSWTEDAIKLYQELRGYIFKSTHISLRAYGRETEVDDVAQAIYDKIFKQIRKRAERGLAGVTFTEMAEALGEIVEPAFHTTAAAALVRRCTDNVLTNARRDWYRKGYDAFIPVDPIQLRGKNEDPIARAVTYRGPRTIPETRSMTRPSGPEVPPEQVVACRATSPEGSFRTASQSPHEVVEARMDLQALARDLIEAEREFLRGWIAEDGDLECLGRRQYQCRRKKMERVEGETLAHMRERL